MTGGIRLPEVGMEGHQTGRTQRPASSIPPAPSVAAGRLSRLGHLDLAAGADNLLLNCVDAAPGDRLLVVREDARHGFYDCTAPAYVADRARVLGLLVDEIEVGPPGTCLDLPLALIEAMAGVDHTVFFARLGDQLRFDGLPGQGTSTVSYAYDAACLGSGFGTTSHALMNDIKSLVERRIVHAERIEVTCPLGTHLVGSPVGFTDDDIGEVRIRRFPLTVFKPVPALGFSGRIALSRWLIGSGSHYYEPYEACLDDTVFAILDRGRAVDFEGPPEVVATVRAHHARVGEMFGIDPLLVHSWHAGFHPQTLYPLPAGHNPTRWSALAFGSPRYLHFHVCGDEPPGEICWTVIDPTITLDGKPAWLDGRLALAETDAVKAVVQRYQDGPAAFAEPSQEIGLQGRNRVIST